MLNRVSWLMLFVTVGVVIYLGFSIYCEVTGQVSDWVESYPGEELEFGGPLPMWPFVICVGVGFCFACMLSLFFRKDGD
jgi:hypothetical protein